MNAPRIAYFGGEPLGVPVLAMLLDAGITPELVVTNPDRPAGRKLILTPPPLKTFAKGHGIEVFQPASLKDPAALGPLTDRAWDLFIVVAYSRIIPKTILDIPARGTLNMHPSLLPSFRGPNPIRAAILEDTRETGVSVIKLGEEMDHGPIVAQKTVTIDEDMWPLRGRDLDALLAREGGELLAKTIPLYLEDRAELREQDHAAATYTKKLTKEDGLIDLDADPHENLRKIRAYDGWPGTYFFTEKNGKQIRVKITDAELTLDGALNILRVIPEGKNEMSYRDLLNS